MKKWRAEIPVHHNFGVAVEILGIMKIPVSQNLHRPKKFRCIQNYRGRDHSIAQ